MWAPSLEYTEACQEGSKTYMWAPSLEYTEASRVYILRGQAYRYYKACYMWAPSLEYTEACQEVQ